MDEPIQLLETPLRELHLAAGARMVPFAGWNMPVQYRDGIISEHNCTRNAASLFDICHMGEFEIDGSGAAEALDAILARPVIDQKPGTCRYNFLLNDRGGVMDDLIVYRLDEEGFFIVVNAATATADAEAISRSLPFEVEFEDVSGITGKLDLQGPGTLPIMQRLGFNPEELPQYYQFIQTEIEGMSCLLSRTGYTGEFGFEFYLDWTQTADLWRLLIKLGAQPAGLGARDTIRLEMGYPLYGHELNPDTTPIEAGFGAMLKLAEMPDRVFTGSAALRNTPPRRRLVGIRLDGRRAAREGTEVYDEQHRLIGKVTSGAFAPSLNCAIAMAYVEAACPSAPGVKVLLKTGNVELPGEITAPPFYKNGTARKKI